MSAFSTRTPEALFESVFWPLYPDDARRDLARARATDANPGRNPALFARLTEAAELFARLAPDAFGEDLGLDGSDASVHRLGQALTLERRARWLEERGPDGAPLLAHVVIHGVAYVGACVEKNHEGAWQLRRPLWESTVRLRSRAGEGDLALFSWWLKSLSDAEIGRGTLADRYRTHVEVPRASPDALPVLVPPDRPLPRLRAPRYDTFFKYLRAHLPELRDVGRDFPSPERFAELAFDWLDFAPVGGGRMLLVHGPSGLGGVHLFWLDGAGFVKSAYYPADAAPAHALRAEGDKLVLSLHVLGRPAEHEMLWWGP
ncbi:MAG TPA: hypothetical protein VFS43_31120 [Polyangiaceae bacterium]|nr:hypothetical protein [Polyangiaceae bacterium]